MAVNEFKAELISLFDKMFVKRYSIRKPLNYEHFKQLISIWQEHNNEQNPFITISVTFSIIQKT
jgi:hypothetical protein